MGHNGTGSLCAALGTLGPAQRSPTLAPPQAGGRDPTASGLLEPRHRDGRVRGTGSGGANALPMGRRDRWSRGIVGTQASTQGAGRPRAPTWRGSLPGTCTHQEPRETAGQGRLASFWVPEATLANEGSATPTGSAPLYPRLGDLTGFAPPCGPIRIPCPALSHPSSASSLRPRKGGRGGTGEGAEKDPCPSSLSAVREETQPTGHLCESPLVLPGDWGLGWSFSSASCKSLGTRGLRVLSFLWSQSLLDHWTQSRDPKVNICDHLNCEARLSFRR